MPTEAIVIGNKAYPNAVVAVEIENQYNSLIDLMEFVTVSHDLVGVAGMTKKIKRYRANLNKTEVLEKGEGNSDSITADYTEEEYKIKLLQNNFKYTDEEAMEDPDLIDTLKQGAPTDMFNKADALCMAEFGKTSHYIVAPNGKFDFDAFVDGVGEFPALVQETGQPKPTIFGFVHKDNVKQIRKELKDALSQVEAYVRTGYIGTVNGVHLYQKATAIKDEIILATKDAVKYENKKGTEVEPVRADANCRINQVFTRKYGLFYLANENFCVRMLLTEPEEAQG